MKRAIAALLVLGAVPLIAPAATYEHTVLLLAFLLAIQAVSWNIISGFAGYISLGHTVFLGIGAYTAGILAPRLDVNPLLIAPSGGIAAVLVAVGIGRVVLRAKGPAFVIITIALLFICQVLAINIPALTNGSDGITFDLPPWSTNIPFYYVFLGLLAITFCFSVWIRRTKLGTGLVAIREDETKAAAIGIPTPLYKTLAYGASALFVGIAGAVYGYFLTFLNPLGAFNILASVMVVLAVLVGGRGTLWGPVVGAFIVALASEAATVYGGGTQSRVLLFGLALVIIVLFLPDGLLPSLRRLLKRVSPVEYIAPPEEKPITVTVGTNPRSRGPILELTNVKKSFGGIHAVDVDTLAVPPGSITALIGLNGSGKTTLFNLVSGTMKPDDGQILLAGERIDRLNPWSRAHRGLGRTFQVTRLFKAMTVLENVVAPLPAFAPRVLASGAINGREADRARELLSFVGLARFESQQAGSLSYGQQKLVELAQVLMLEPRLVLLDEPAGGVNPAMIDRLAEIIRAANRQGISFLIVEHNIPMVRDLCDPVFVLAGGEVVASGAPAAAMDAYLEATI